MKHSFATQRVNEGYSLDEIKAVLGHADIRSTERYGKYQTEKLANVMRGKKANSFTPKNDEVHNNKPSKTKDKMAGVGGFEPPNPGSKDLCLTA